VIARSAMLISILAAVVGCRTEPDRDTSAAGDVEPAIQASVAAYSRTAQAGQVDSFAALFADDAMLLPPNAPAVRGREGARSILSPMTFTELRSTAVEIESRGDLAVARGGYTFSGRMRDAPTPVRDTGKWVAVWRRQPDGTWLIVTNIWNSDLPLAPSAPPTRR
jgi:ketosteroid isomerase-like protein